MDQAFGPLLCIVASHSSAYCSLFSKEQTVELETLIQVAKRTSNANCTAI